MALKTPLSLMKDKFGEKAKLVEALEKLTGDELWVSRTNKNKGLAHVSNAKLLRLHATFTEVKQKFGTRDKLVDALLDAEKRPKDAGFRERVSEWPVPRLFDAYKSAARRSHAGGKPVTAKTVTEGATADAAPKAGAKKGAKGAPSAPTAAAKAAPKAGPKEAAKTAKKTASKAGK